MNILSTKYYPWSTDRSPICRSRPLCNLFYTTVIFAHHFHYYPIHRRTFLAVFAVEAVPTLARVVGARRSFAVGTVLTRVRFTCVCMDTDNP